MTSNSSNAGKSVSGRFPDFLCIGAQKAGTSWLYDNLRAHPRIWLPPVKELHYFNHVHIKEDRQWTPGHRRTAGEAALRRYLRTVAPEKRNPELIGRLKDFISGSPNDDWYAGIFALADPSAVCGDITPRYALLPPEGVQHVQRLMPKVKVIYILRDPIDRCWSHIRMVMENRGVSVRSLPVIEKIAKRPAVLGRADYSSTYAAWSVAESEGRLLTLFYDDIDGQPESLLREVCAFFEIEYEDELFRDMRKHVHVGLKLGMPPEVYSLLKTQLAPTYRDIARRFPERGERWMSAHYGS